MSANQLYSGVFVALTAALLLLLALGVGLPWLAAYLLAISTSTLAAYGYDKIAARSDFSRSGNFNRARVPENVLHAMALAGGSPGALLAQQLWRHKTSKTGFQRVYWLIVAVQAALLIYWLAHTLL